MPYIGEGAWINTIMTLTERAVTIEKLQAEIKRLKAAIQLYANEHYEPRCECVLCKADKGCAWDALRESYLLSKGADDEQDGN